MWEETSPRLGLPLLHAGQAQKELSHNEALARIDIAAQAVAISAGAVAPPADPEPGQCWILAAAPEGDWAGHAHAIAGWTDGGWRFVPPREGMRAWVVEARAFAQFLEGEWGIGRLHGRLFVDGEQLVGPRGAAIADPSGGEAIDVEARAAIAAVLAALRAHGLIGTG